MLDLSKLFQLYHSGCSSPNPHDKTKYFLTQRPTKLAHQPTQPLRESSTKKARPPRQGKVQDSAELTFSTCQLEEKRPVAYLQVSREPFAFERSSIEGTFVQAPPDPRTSELTQNLEKKIIFKMFNSSDQSSLPPAGDFPRARQT